MQQNRPIATLLSKELKNEQQLARHCLNFFFETVLFLGRQGISLRGHEEKESNVYQLLKMLSTDDPKLKQWMENRPSYISHEIQNEILKITSHQITKNIVDEIKKAQYFSIILDGTQDVSKIDQHC